MTVEDIPNGWVEGTVAHLGEFVNGCAFKPEDWVGQGMPIIRIQNLTDPSKPLNLTEKKVDSKYVVERGDILVSWSATLDVFIWNGPRALVNQHIFKVVPTAELEKGFVFYALKEAIAELINTEHLHGTTMKHINRKPFLAHAVPIPPLPEQRRIVEKIETLFAQLDKGEEAVRQVQVLLKRYRQSVLKAAVTGELTADWREANRERLEHGRDLLARVLETRRENWEGRGRYKEPDAPDTSELPELPEGWVWTSMGQIAHVLGGLTKNAKRKDMATKRPMLRVANVYQGRFDLSEIHLTGITENELPRVRLETGDILIVEGNGSKDQIGRMAIWDNEIPDAVHQNHLIKARLAVIELAPYILTWFQSIEGRAAIEKIASSTSGLYTLSISKIEALPVPLPPLSEAEEIQAAVRQATSQAATLENWTETELTRSSALRQSILKQAFSGELVPQDPSDEPASDLLARVRAVEPAKKKRKAKA